MKTLTAKWLEERDACTASLGRFRQIFGEECQVTSKNVARWLDVRGEAFTDEGARHDLGWLVLRLVGREKPRYFGFWSLPMAEAVLRHLGIYRQMDKAYHAMNAVVSLPIRRLVKAIEQIAERSPNL